MILALMFTCGCGTSSDRAYCSIASRFVSMSATLTLLLSVSTLIVPRGWQLPVVTICTGCGVAAGGAARLVSPKPVAMPLLAGVAVVVGHWRERRPLIASAIAAAPT